MKLGTRTTWYGMISVASRTPKIMPLPRNDRNAKANAAREQAISIPIVVNVAILIEFRKKSPKVTPGRAFHIFT